MLPARISSADQLDIYNEIIDRVVSLNDHFILPNKVAFFKNTSFVVFNAIVHSQRRKTRSRKGGTCWANKAIRVFSEGQHPSLRCLRPLRHRVRDIVNTFPPHMKLQALALEKLFVDPESRQFTRNTWAADDVFERWVPIIKTSQDPDTLTFSAMGDMFIAICRFFKAASIGLRNIGPYLDEHSSRLVKPSSETQRERRMTEASNLSQEIARHKIKVLETSERAITVLRKHSTTEYDFLKRCDDIQATVSKVSAMCDLFKRAAGIYGDDS